MNPVAWLTSPEPSQCPRNSLSQRDSCDIRPTVLVDAYQKVAIVREHLLDDVPVSELCDKHGISPVNYYKWQRQLFENGAVAFERKPNGSNERRRHDAQQEKIEKLEAKLEKKNEVIAELLEEHVQLKNTNGEP